MKYNININYYLNKFINKIKNNNNYIKDSNYLIIQNNNEYYKIYYVIYYNYEVFKKFVINNENNFKTLLEIEKNFYINYILLLLDYKNKKIINYFKNNYKINENKIFKNPKNEFRYFCYRFLNNIKKIKLPNIQLNKDYEAVLIEYRCLPHLEFIIRNNIYKLGSKWSYTIICGNLNYNFILNMTKNISNNIKIIKTNFDNLNQEKYSYFLTKLNFWNLLKGKKILIHQEDSIIFKSNIEDFIDWDYIGAPWPKNQNDNSNSVGNGGFSLRTKQSMIDVINKISLEKTIFNSNTLKYMKRKKLKYGPEDVYFSLNMLKYNIGKVANWKQATLFSSETIFNENSVGCHNMFSFYKNWKFEMIKNIYV